ncbi:MAG: FG-GAP repeat protein, partial [Planctomycetaceae bacterium]
MNLHQLNLACGKSWFRSFSNAAAVLLVLTGCERGTEMSAEKANVGAFAMETAREEVSVAADSLGTQQDAPTLETSIRLVDEARDRGLQFERFDDMQGQRRILEVNGGGVGVVDVDGDGWLDVFLPNGCEIPISSDSGRNPGQLFRNLRGRFQEISESSRLEQFGFGTGVAAGDVNEDGFPDLYITRIGTDQLWL